MRVKKAKYDWKIERIKVRIIRGCIVWFKTIDGSRC